MDGRGLEIVGEWLQLAAIGSPVSISRPDCSTPTANAACARWVMAVCSPPHGCRDSVLRHVPSSSRVVEASPIRLQADWHRARPQYAPYSGHF